MVPNFLIFTIADRMMDNSIFSRDNFFRYYIYGYLNSRVAILGRNMDSLKATRKQEIRNYINIDGYPKWMGMLFIWTVIHFELPISIIIECLYYFLYVIKGIKSNKIEKGERIYIGIREQRLKNILNNAHIQLDSVTVITFSNEENSIFNDFFQKSLCSCVSLKDMTKAFIWSLQMTWFLMRKYGKTDCFFRVYSSFEFFLTCKFCEKLDSTNEVLYTSTYSRWGYLFGNLPIKTIFLQHGIIGDRLPFLIKAGVPDRAFFLNDEERQNCCRFLFSNVPEVNYLDGLKFTSNEKLLDNGRKNVLIVCNLIHFNKEQCIAHGLMDNGTYNIYMKPHPLDSISKYKELAEDLPIVLLDKADYPKVDIVISYNSTLAIEYRDVGINVIWHDNLDAGIILKEVKKMLD